MIDINSPTALGLARVLREKLEADRDMLELDGGHIPHTQGRIKALREILALVDPEEPKFEPSIKNIHTPKPTDIVGF